MCHCVGQRTNIPTSRPGGVWSSQWIQAGLVFNAENSNASYPRCRSHRARLKLPDDLPPPLMALLSLQPPSLFIDSSSTNSPRGISSLPLPSVLALCQIAPQRGELLPQLFFRVSTPSRSITSLPANSPLSRIYRKPVCDPDCPSAFLPCRLCSQRLPPWAARPSLAIAV